MFGIEQEHYNDSRALAKEIHKLTKGRELSEEFSYEEKQKMAAKLYRKFPFRTVIVQQQCHCLFPACQKTSLLHALLLFRD